MIDEYDFPEYNEYRELLLGRRLRGNMHIQSFGNSCGANIVHGFPYWGATGEEEARFEDWCRKYKQTNSIVAFAVLSGDQMKFCHDIMLRYGWRLLVENFYNPVHESLLSLYMFEPHPEKRPNSETFKSEQYFPHHSSCGYRTLNIKLTASEMTNAWTRMKRRLVLPSKEAA